jgi:TRAP-type C4-dicarboxylate transport system permease small subunit
MTAIERTLNRSCNWLENVAGVALVSIMLFSGIDIVGRAFGKPIPGTYEVISFAGGLIVGLAVPASAVGKVHIMVDMFSDKLSLGSKAILHCITRLIGGALLSITGFALIKLGSKLKAAGEYTPVLEISFYPVAYAMGVAFIVTALVLIMQAINIIMEPTKPGGVTNA